MTTPTHIAYIATGVRKALAAAEDERALEGWRTTVLGRSRAGASVVCSRGELALEERREVGGV